MLRDPVTGEERNLRDESAYSVVAGSVDQPRKLSLVVGRNLQVTSSWMHPAKNPLLEAFPNPFWNATTITFSVDETAPSTIRVYDALGRLVSVLADREQFSTGQHSVVWDALNTRGAMLARGWYIIRLENGRKSKSIGVSIAR